MFVGRADELNRLMACVKKLGSGHGGAVWLTGDPGIGKSTLIAAALAAAEEQGCRVYSAAAHEHSEIFPLGVLRDAVARVDPVMRQGSAPDAIDTMLALFHRVCADCPVVLVVEDAQWADDASLALLERLCEVVGQLPLLVMVSARPVPRRPATVALGEALVAAGALALALGPLGEAEVAELALPCDGTVANPDVGTLLDGAGGNPLYVRELLDALACESRQDLRAGLPAALVAAIRRRLCYLSEPTAALLQTSAILGRAFTVAELGIVTGQSENTLGATLDEAVTAGVLVTAEAESFAFRHALVHRVLYQSTPATVRAAIHHEFAERLARAGRDAGAVAKHLVAAPDTFGPWENDWITETAPLLTLRDPQAAVEVLRRTLQRLAPHDPRRERAEVELASARLRLGDDEGVVHLCSAVRPDSCDPAIASRIAWTLAHALARLGRLGAALAVTSRALNRAELSSLWSSRLRARHAISLLAIGRYDEAWAAAERAAQEGQEARDSVGAGHALYAQAMVELHHRRQAAAGIDLIDRALEVLGDDPHTTDLALLLTVFRGGALNELGACAEADQQFDRAAALAQQCTEPTQAQAQVLTALHLFYRGRWNEALAHVDAAVSLPLDRAYRRCVAGVAAQIALHRDDRVALEANTRGIEQVELVETETRTLVEVQLLAWARRAERDRRPAEALTRMLAILDPAGTLQFTRLGGNSSLWLADVVRLAVAVGDAAVAAGAAEAGVREANLRPSPAAKASAQHCQGLLDGDPSAALAAAEIYRTGATPLFNAMALEDAAVLYAEKGELDCARAAYLESIGIYENLAAAWDLMRADARLRPYKIRRGIRGTRCRPAMGWEALTETEQKIAHLIAVGRSNPDIAEHMFVSRYTVESHVSHILKKLSARSRVEIARAAAER